MSGCIPIGMGGKEEGGIGGGGGGGRGGEGRWEGGRWGGGGGRGGGRRWGRGGGEGRERERMSHILDVQEVCLYLAELLGWKVVPPLKHECRRSR